MRALEHTGALAFPNHLKRTPDATSLTPEGARYIPYTPCVHIQSPSQLVDPILMEYHWKL